MVAVPLLSGIAGSETGEFVRSFPINLEPVIVDSGISKGQLKLIPGAIQCGTGPGADRGGIAWNGAAYRVMGSKLCRIDADWTVTELGDVGNDGKRCAFDYSFDRLSIWSTGSLYYYAISTGLIQVTDTDLGTVIDGIWIDSYFMSTDGTYIVVTELSDPTQIKPLKYGSAEEDPDPITGLIRYRTEAYVLGRYTIQVFEDVGGNGFPFQDQKGGGFPFGCVSPAAKALFGDGFAFVGSGRNEGLNVYYAALEGIAKPIGGRELCDALDALPDPSVVEVESRSSKMERRLFVHLPTETWVFLLNASSLAGQPVWYRIKTGSGAYRCRNAVNAYGKTIVADSTGALGYLTEDDDRHFGSDPGWQFDCGLLYNESLGAIIHSVELVGLPGRGRAGTAFLSMTRDGETFGAERAVCFAPADRTKRIAWRPHARMGNYLGFRFRGSGGALPGFAACEVKAAPLSS
jgi:hypothetical protein